MRILVIIASFLLGLVGLLMSVCGGGLFYSQALRAGFSLFHPTGANHGAGSFNVLLISAFVAGIGVLLCWAAVQLYRQSERDEDDKL